MKKCKRCKKTLPYEAFDCIGKSVKGINKYRSYCKTCMQEYMKEYRKTYKRTYHDSSDDCALCSLNDKKTGCTARKCVMLE